MSLVCDFCHLETHSAYSSRDLGLLVCERCMVNLARIALAKVADNMKATQEKRKSRRAKRLVGHKAHKEK